jgi:hypothetical protein
MNGVPKPVIGGIYCHFSAAVRCYSEQMRHPTDDDVPKWAYVAFAIFLGVGFLAVTYFAPML